MRFILFIILLPFTPILLVGGFYLLIFALILSVPWAIASALSGKN